MNTIHLGIANSYYLYLAIANCDERASGKSITDYELKITNVVNGEWLIENPQP